MNGPRIVVGTDGSTAAERALTWASQAAVAGATPLLIVTCVDQSAVNQADRDKRIADGQAVLAEATAAAFEADVDKADAELATGDASLALLRAGDGASMLVVGTHGHGFLPSVLLGSIAYRVADRASCPVVLVGEHDRLPSDGTSGAVVVGLSYPDSGGEALDFALDQATRFGRRLLAIHATDAGSSQPTDHDKQRIRIAELVEAAARAHPDVKVELKVLDGDAATALAAWADPGSLVVLGSGRHKKHRIGTIAADLLRTAQCPVAIVGASAS